MRVAVFTSYPKNGKPCGGVESVALALCQALELLDTIELHIVTMERSIKKTEISIINRNTTVHRLPAGNWPQMLNILFGPGKYRLGRYLKSLKPDIIHFHETYGLTYPKISIPTVFTIHGFDHANILAERQRMAWLRSLLWKLVERWGLSTHSHIISITPYVRNHIEKMTKAAIYDIDNPIDPAYFSIKRDAIPMRLFFAGWIAPRKNPLIIIKALGKLVKKDINAHLHLAGEAKDPHYLSEINQEIHNLKLEDRVTLLGRIAPAEMQKELSQAQVFILPAFQENAPMVISEALAAGIPVITSNNCGMPFMIEEGKTGYLIEPDDVEMLSERIACLLLNSDQNASFSKAARQSALERFHPESVAKKTYEVYQKIVRFSQN